MKEERLNKLIEHLEEVHPDTCPRLDANAKQSDLPFYMDNGRNRMNDKSILVLNTPKNCHECDIATYLGKGLLFCSPIYADVEVCTHDRAPDCPLRPLPDELIRNKPLTPILEGDGYADGNMVYDIASCPMCGTELTESDNDLLWKLPYCPYCGQKLNWDFLKEERK